MKRASSTVGLPRRRPIVSRCLLIAVTWFAYSLLGPRRALAQTAPVILDAARVIELARAHAPGVVTADARIGEARALHVGARAGSIVNPEISIFAGPRFVTSNTAVPDVSITLIWPIDVSGARAVRVTLADDRTRAAEADADDARLNAAAEALDLWVRALGADARVQLETERARLDTAVLTIARVQRAAGTVGDGDVALATGTSALGAARLRTAEADRIAALALLRGRLGLEPASAVVLAGTLATINPPPMEILLAGLEHRPDLVRSAALIGAARTDASLQSRLGVPLPRLTLNGAHDPEYSAHVGLDLPLPIYQRNQTNVAVATARIETAVAERRGIGTLAASDVRAAYANYIGARDALQALEAARTAIDDAEHLATRGYELGQSPLASLVAVRREVATARAAHLDARVALAHARVAVDRAAGTLR